MTKKDEVRAAIEETYNEGTEIFREFRNSKTLDLYRYQIWYTKALKIVASLAPDRILEFRAYYEINPTRKALGYGTYVLQDYLRNVIPNERLVPNFDSFGQASLCVFNQVTILKAVMERADSTLLDIESALYSDLQDNEIETARRLAKVNLRAAGALIGVVIEGHLQKVASARGVKCAKKNPTIADLNDPLKAANVIDIPTWRRISYLADIRNICSHKKDREPTADEVADLINGAEWVSKNVF